MKKEDIKKLLAIPKYKALIKLCCYLLIIILIIIFTQILNAKTRNYSTIIKNNTTILDTIKNNNYTLNIDIEIDDVINSYVIYKDNQEEKIIKIVDEQEKNYYYKDNTYYILDSNNYLLTNKDEVYDIIDYTYIDINNIAKYINLGTLEKKENNIKYYKIMLKNIILDYEEYDYINIEESLTSIKIDYTNLFTISNSEKEKVVVTLTYSNIGKTDIDN